MLSYRHAFHAGNHADILKHSTLFILLQHFLKKDKPFTYVDTHSGAGFYSLKSEWAEKTQESKEGIELLLNSCKENPSPECIAGYIKNAQNYYKTDCYAGSPQLAYDVTREQDSLVLSELHPADFELLYDSLGKKKRVHVHKRNGFELLTGLNFPARTLVLIDPSYETESDYHNVLDAVQRFYAKNSTATIAVWLPLVGRRKELTDGLIHGLQNIVPLEEKFLYVELSQRNIQDVTSDYGMYGSVMAIINPPWLTKKELATTFEWLCPSINMDFTIDL